MSEANRKLSVPKNPTNPAAERPVFLHLYDDQERASVLQKIRDALQASLTLYRGAAVSANAILKAIDNDYGINGEVEARKLGFSTFDALLQTSYFARVLEVVWSAARHNEASFARYKLKPTKDIEHIVGREPGAVWVPDNRRAAKLREARQMSRSRHAEGGRSMRPRGPANAQGILNGGTSNAPASLVVSGQPEFEETRPAYCDTSEADREGQLIEGRHHEPQSDEPTNNDGGQEEEGVKASQNHTNTPSVVAVVRPSSAPGAISVFSSFVVPAENAVDDLSELQQAILAPLNGEDDEEEELYTTPPSELCSLHENDADDERVDELSEGEWVTMTELEEESALITDSEIAMTVELDVAPDSVRSSPGRSASTAQPCSATPVPTNEFEEPLMFLTYAVYMVVSQRYTIEITDLADCICQIFGRDVQPMSEYGVVMEWPKFIETYCRSLGVACAQIHGETVCCLRVSPAKGVEAVKAAMTPYLQCHADAEEW